MTTKITKRKKSARKSTDAANQTNVATERQPLIPAAEVTKLKGRLPIAIADLDGNIVRIASISDPRVTFCREWNTTEQNSRAFPLPELPDIPGLIACEQKKAAV